jgi:hypothetical protein
MLFFYRKNMQEVVKICNFLLERKLLALEISHMTVLIKRIS